MTAGVITSRAADEGDIHRLFEWRNDPATRAMCLNDEPVPWKTHVAWFARALGGRSTQLRILEAEGRAVATARFDYVEPTEFSFTIAPEYRCKGLSLRLMKVAMSVETDFVAHVRVENRPCQRLVSAAGMRLIRDGQIQLWVYGEPCLDPMSQKSGRTPSPVADQRGQNVDGRGDTIAIRPLSD